MTSKVIDLRLRKIERAMEADEFDHLTDEGLNDMIRTHLEILIEPYGRDLVALRNAYMCSPDPEERETVQHLDYIIANIGEFYPQADVAEARL